MSPTLEHLKDKKKVKRMLTHFENLPNSSTNCKMKDVKINEARLIIPKIYVEKVACDKDQEEEVEDDLKN